jgi:hypothetical protein
MRSSKWARRSGIRSESSEANRSAALFISNGAQARQTADSVGMTLGRPLVSPGFAGMFAPPPVNRFCELVGIPRVFGVRFHAGFLSGRLTSANVATWVLSNQDSNTAPHTSQDA